MFRNNAGKIGLAGDGIGNIKARVDVIAGVDVTMTT
jgi:hypothetical protein